MAKYNLKIVFANKFIWFLLAALILYLLCMFVAVYNGADADEKLVYSLLIFPAILLIFYPTTFGIQNDYDNRILEILFGIPNYRYKVWLIRLAMSYVAIFVLLLLFSLMTSYLLCPTDVFGMTIQIMFPLFFLGNMTFWLSTITRSGNATAIIMIILGIILTFMGTKNNGIGNTVWDVFINPFHANNQINPVVWANTLMKNRLYLTIGAVVLLIGGILNLQRREKFIG